MFFLIECNLGLDIHLKINTNPPLTFLQSAHMAVTEALMSLFLKESVSTSRVLSTVRRMDKNSKALDSNNGDLESSGLDPDSADPEEALMLWVSESCRAVKKKAMDEVVGSKADKESDQVRYFESLKDDTISGIY